MRRKEWAFPVMRSRDQGFWRKEFSLLLKQCPQEEPAFHFSKKASEIQGKLGFRVMAFREQGREEDGRTGNVEFHAEITVWGGGLP